jgi:hypothetical protein
MGKGMFADDSPRALNPIGQQRCRPSDKPELCLAVPEHAIDLDGNFRLKFNRFIVQ